eukprot:6426202-Amphidinium_carterae.1
MRARFRCHYLRQELHRAMHPLAENFVGELTHTPLPVQYRATDEDQYFSLRFAHSQSEAHPRGRYTKSLGPL